MILPREGFTIDFVARVARKSFLNPTITIPVALGGNFVSAQQLGVLRPGLYVLAVLSFALSLTDYLNRGFNNNWTDSRKWNWDREVVVITGGSSGIGASLAQQLYHRNSLTRIVIIDYVPLSWKPAEHSRIKYYQCDLSNPSLIRPLCDKIRNEVGHPTVLVNNAGISRGTTVCDGPHSDVELTINTNMMAPFLLAKEFLPEMARRDHGHVFNVSSMSAFLPPSKVADYAATKAGLIALHEALQLELKLEHAAPCVRLSLAVLSFIRTPLFKGETRQSHFLFPLLDVETVSDSIADILYSGYGKTIYMPGIMRYVASLRGGPEWLWRIIREATKGLGVDFRGRQKVDPKTGKLVQ